MALTGTLVSGIRFDKINIYNTLRKFIPLTLLTNFNLCISAIMSVFY